MYEQKTILKQKVKAKSLSKKNKKKRKPKTTTIAATANRLNVNKHGDGATVDECVGRQTAAVVGKRSRL